MNDLKAFVIQSFAENRGTRGVHFFDSMQCEFLPWDEVLAKMNDQFPEKFCDKLVEAVANYNPDTEFVTVCAGGGQITIELFKSHEM
jgi:hypothetical protein